MPNKNPLDELAELMDRVDSMRLRKQEEYEKIIAPVKDDLKVLDIDFDDHIAQAQADVDTLTSKLKAEAIAEQCTLVGERLQITLVKGRETVDVSGLKGYGKAHPEVLEFIRTGEASTRLVRKEKK